ncbi:MAG: DEAD/DEAH box helicase family protein [Clostridia bacterium]|nr:DEAD/DEAH box helicase family protein [Clostridia bacterium]
MQLKTNKKSEINKVVEMFNNIFSSIKSNKQSNDAQMEDVDDSSSPVSGEIITDEVISLDLGSIDLFSAPTKTVNALTSADGLVHSLNTYGCVDIKYISSLTNKPVKTVLNDLRGSIYQNPEKFVGDITTGWETADEYLTGNIGEKLKTAKKLNLIHRGYFNANVEALTNVLPRCEDIENIYIKLGAPWIPEDLIEAFIRNLLKMRKSGFLKHDTLTGSWEIVNKVDLCRECDYTKVYVTYGTYRMNALNIIEKSLNMQTISVKDEYLVLDKKKYVVNEKETFLAIDKQKIIDEMFNRWLKLDDSRINRLKNIYESKYCSIRTRKFDGSFLTFPNMNPAIRLYPYQKDAIARILFTPNTLLAHDVGAGKTYIMVAAGMELKRMGISNKNMYVVPNNIVEQWANVFKVMYPKSKILTVTPNKFTPAKRVNMLKDMCDGEYDAIVIAYSCFSMIPMSKKYMENYFSGIINDLRRVIANGSQTRTVTERIKSVKKELEKYRETCKLNEDDITFDKLNINTLFIDEAHNYKNLPFDTKTSGILGISATGSQKCRDLYSKVRCVQADNNGRGVVFATGTPITNSLSDLFVIQKYLQPTVLESMNIANFDAWIANFAELVTCFEVDVDTSGYRMARRFSKFHNLPELTTILSLIADFHPAKCSESMPMFKGHTDCMTDKSKDLENYINKISTRVENIRSRRVSSKDDNMLKVTTDGRKAALDVRLVNPKAKFSDKSKIYQCACKVAETYFKTCNDGGTQLVFCDASTPKSTFNAYDELKRLLIALKVPESEIAFVHDASSDSQREKLFKMMRDSTIKILIGSTWKLGVGVNIQDKLVAIHHLDVPWRPADMVQREGRILRPGNQNDEVFIYRYITEGTFDAYSWQLLETKQRFISSVLSGSIKVRAGRDIGDTVLNYGEAKALAIGNPLVKARVEATNELSRLLSMQSKTEELKVDMQAQINELPSFIEQKDLQIERCIADIKHYEESKVEYTREQLKELGRSIIESLACNSFETEERKIASYQGFDIILPAGMTEIDPFIYVEHNGRYKLPYKLTDIGIMIRLNNLLEGLPEYLAKLQDSKTRLINKLEGLKVEVEKQYGYCDRIEELKTTIRQLDKKLGVKINE